MKPFSDTYTIIFPLSNLHFNLLQGIHSVRSKSLFNSLVDKMEKKFPNTPICIFVIAPTILAHGERPTQE